MSSRRDNRAVAMQFLYQWSLNKPENLNRDLDGFFVNLPNPREYYQFGEELIRGAIEHMDTIDEIIRKYTQNWDFARVARIDLAILRLAIYEMQFRRDIPPVVSINEAIDLSKQYSIPDARRFINGILDQYKLTLDRPAREAAI